MVLEKVYLNEWQNDEKNKVQAQGNVHPQRYHQRDQKNGADVSDRKTCYFFKNRKSCRFGMSCRFSHKSDSKIQQKEKNFGAHSDKKICYFFNQHNSCRFGTSCIFSHETEFKAKPQVRPIGNLAPKPRDIAKYRTNILIIKGLSKKDDPSVEWIQQRLVDADSRGRIKKVDKVIQFTTNFGTVLTRIDFKDQKTVTNILRKRNKIKSVNEGMYRHLSFFAHRPKFIRDQYRQTFDSTISCRAVFRIMIHRILILVVHISPILRIHTFLL